MPALGRFVNTDVNLSLTAGAGAGVAEAACPCGKRRPVGVLLGLRSGGRPRMDNRWFCRRACLEQTLLQRARRDFPEGAVTPSKVRHRVPMGLILQARGAVTAMELQEALRVQGGTGLRLGEVLTGQFGVPEDRITAAIAAQWGLPVLHLPTASPMSLASLAPLPLFQASGSLPVERTANRLLLACADGPDPALALALERMHPVRVSFGVASPRVLEGWRSSAAAMELPVQRVECADRESMARAVSEMLYKLQPVESRVVRLGSVWWLRAWLEDAARHTGTGEDTVDVLYTVQSRTQDSGRIELCTPEGGEAEPFVAQAGRAASATAASVADVVAAAAPAPPMEALAAESLPAEQTAVTSLPVEGTPVTAGAALVTVADVWQTAVPQAFNLQALDDAMRTAAPAETAQADTLATPLTHPVAMDDAGPEAAFPAEALDANLAATEDIVAIEPSHAAEVELAEGLLQAEAVPETMQLAPEPSESAPTTVELAPGTVAVQAFVMPSAAESVVTELSFAAWHEDGRDTAPHSEMEAWPELGIL